jgi:PTH1 family peptidyl-tRNA hydrolase
MKLIVGLGNPGARYQATRHNVGVRVLDAVASRVGAGPGEPRYRGIAAEASVAGTRVLLLAPETWMNRSGDAVAAALAAHPELDPATDLLVVFDDADLPLGRLRIRARGSSGGHNGLGDVLEQLAIETVPRLRFGIGRPQQPSDTVDWVLTPFREDEEASLARALPRAADAVLCFVQEGIAPAMNRFNGPWPEPQPEPDEADPRAVD